MTLLRCLFFTLLVAACSSPAYQRACLDDEDCNQLGCHRIEGLPPFCSGTCGVSDDCRARFGETSYCSVASVCMESCTRDDDCPHEGECSDEGYCSSPRADS